jgi:hypothetical protein
MWNTGNVTAEPNRFNLGQGRHGDGKGRRQIRHQRSEFYGDDYLVQLGGKMKKVEDEEELNIWDLSLEETEKKKK